MHPSSVAAVAVAGLVTAACGAGRAEAPRAVAVPVPAPVPEVEATPAPDLFATAVKPMLAQRCGPCHNPGGQMHERLPFDQPAVVAANRVAILGRIKAPEDRGPLEQWLVSRP